MVNQLASEPKKQETNDPQTPMRQTTLYYINKLMFWPSIAID